uniref:C-type LECtin n=1 Tax=Panagrellus redivivus TaxID=6233 RepID=A0A7E4VEV2_PANRE
MFKDRPKLARLMVSYKSHVLFLAVCIVFCIAEDPCPSGWFYGSNVNQCYLIPDIFLPFEDAKDYCTNVTGGELVSVYSQVESDAISSYIKSTTFAHLYPLWIGLKYTRYWPYYKWQNDLSTNYTNWVNNTAPTDAKMGSCFAWKSTLANSGWTTLNCKYQQPFICKQHAINCPTISINAENGTLSSPNYPDLYDLNDVCVYHITVPKGEVVHLKFKVVSIDSYSSVNAYNGPTLDSPLLGHARQGEWDWYGGEEVESTSNTMTLRFTTGSYNSYWNHGWTADFTSRPAPVPVTMNGTHGNLASPNYPMDYNSRDNTFYQINAPENYRIVFTIWDFITEKDYDWLQIFEEGKELLTWSGNYKTQVPYTFHSTGSSVNAIWHSSYSINYKGYNLTWVAEPLWG